MVLPPWAGGSPEECVRLHRQALEGEVLISSALLEHRGWQKCWPGILHHSQLWDSAAILQSRRPGFRKLPGTCLCLQGLQHQWPMSTACLSEVATAELQAQPCLLMNYHARRPSMRQGLAINFVRKGWAAGGFPEAARMGRPHLRRGPTRPGSQGRLQRVLLPHLRGRS